MPREPTSTASATLAVPGYVLGELLGEGATAQVWRARPRPDPAAAGDVGGQSDHGAGGDEVAIKVVRLHDGVGSGPARAEAALLTALDHPHLIALHGTVELPPSAGRARLALILDLAGGGSLAALLRRRGRLAAAEVITAVAPVATALAYVHDLGLVHGDVSPANLLFTSSGMPLLADLGVAAVIGSYGEVRTTAAYADPAVAAGGRPTMASDVFMLAATAFHALTGAPPWPDPLPGLALARAAVGDLEPIRSALRDVPHGVQDVLLEALRPEPHLRPSAAAFALDLRHALAPIPVELRAGRAPARPGFERPDWTGSAPPTSQRETRTATGRVPAAPAASGSSRRALFRRPPSPGKPAKSPPVKSSPGDGSVRGDAPHELGRASVRGDAPHEPGRGRRTSRPPEPTRSARHARHARPAVRSERTARRPARSRRPALLAVIGAVLAGLAVGAWTVAGNSGNGAAVVAASSAAAIGPPATPNPTPDAARPAMSPNPAADRSGAGPSAPDSATAGAGDGPPSGSGSGTAAGAGDGGTANGPPDWMAVLDGLDAQRATAYAGRDPAALAAVYAPGPLLERDRAQLTAIVPAGCSLAGARTRYRDLTTPDAATTTATLEVHAELATSTLRCPARADESVPGVPDTALRITLVAVDGGFRISSQQTT